MKDRQLQDEQNKFHKQFDPDTTEITDYALPFCKLGAKVELDIGIATVLIEAAPCALARLIMLLPGLSWGELDEEYKHADNKEWHNVTFFDARKNSPGDIHETGFKLVRLDNNPFTNDCHSNLHNVKDPDIKKFQKQMEPHIKSWYPNAKKILWVNNVVRGRDMLTDAAKAIDHPHVDFLHNRTALVDFYSRNPSKEIGAKL